MHLKGPTKSYPILLLKNCYPNPMGSFEINHLLFDTNNNYEYSKYCNNLDLEAPDLQQMPKVLYLHLKHYLYFENQNQ